MVHIKFAIMMSNNALFSNRIVHPYQKRSECKDRHSRQNDRDFQFDLSLNIIADGASILQKESQL